MNKKGKRFVKSVVRAIKKFLIVLLSFSYLILVELFIGKYIGFLAFIFVAVVLGFTISFLHYSLYPKKKTHKHYVVVNDWAIGTERKVEIVAVAHSMEKAKKFLNVKKEERKALVIEKGYIVSENTDTKYEARGNGLWVSDHIVLYIVEME